jgi:hypothetical protein
MVFGGMSGSRIGANEDGVLGHGNGRGHDERVTRGNPLVYSMGGPSSGRVVWIEFRVQLCLYCMRKK